MPIRRCPTSARGCARCSPPTRKAGGRDACLLLHAEDGRARDRAARAPRPRPAGAGDPARGASRRVGRPRRLARRAGAGRVAGRGARDRRRGAAVPRSARPADGHRRHASRRRWATRASTSACSTRADTAALRRARCGRWPAALPVRAAATFALDRRQAHDGRARDRASRAARAGAAARDRAAGRRAVRHDRRQPRHLHDVPRLRRRVPGRRDPRHRRRAPQLRFIEAKCVQCGLCAATCPEHAIALDAAARPRAARRRQPRVLNEAAIFHCIALRQADGHREDGRRRCSARLAGHSMFAAPGALDRLQDVRRLPRRST